MRAEVAAERLKLQLIQAIREWIDEEYLTQEMAGHRMGTSQTNLSGVLGGRRHFRLDWLITCWLRSGGQVEIRLRRDQAPPHPYIHV